MSALTEVGGPFGSEYDNAMQAKIAPPMITTPATAAHSNPAIETPTRAEATRILSLSAHHVAIRYTHREASRLISSIAFFSLPWTARESPAKKIITKKNPATSR